MTLGRLMQGGLHCIWILALVTFLAGGAYAAEPIPLDHWQGAWAQNGQAASLQPVRLNQIPAGPAGYDVLCLETRLPENVPLNASLYVWELPAEYEIYVDDQLVEASHPVSGGAPIWLKDFHSHRVIPLGWNVGGKTLKLRLWGHDPNEVNPQRVLVGSRGDLLWKHMTDWFSFLLLGVALGLAGLISVVVFCFRPHPRPLLFMGLLAGSFAFISLWLSGALSLLFDYPILLALGLKISIFTSLIWLALLLSELLEGYWTQRMLQLLAVTQGVLAIVGLSFYAAQVTSFHTLSVIWRDVTLFLTIPCVGLLVIWQVFRRDVNAFIITIVGVVPFCLIAVMAFIEPVTGIRVDPLRALPWAAAAMVTALATVLIRQAIHLMREHFIQQQQVRARQQELLIASRVQETLLTDTPPQNFYGLEMAALTVPSQKVDGDFFEFIQTGPESLDVIVGDVMGKGVPAALVGAACKQKLLKAAFDLEHSNKRADPLEIIQVVHQSMSDEMIKVGRFVTLFYARFDMAQLMLNYVNCGHIGAIHYRVRLGDCETFTGENMPLGFTSKAQYVHQTAPLEEGDMVVMYSDGITEARRADGEFFGQKRMEEFIIAHHDRSIGELLELLRREVKNFIGRDHFDDDLTCLAVRLKKH